MQFLAELNDDEDEAADDDEEEDELDEEELDCDEPEPPLDVVWLAELLLPPHPAASTTSAVTATIANACLMPGRETYCLNRTESRGSTLGDEIQWRPEPGSARREAWPTTAVERQEEAGQRGKHGLPRSWVARRGDS